MRSKSGYLENDLLFQAQKTKDIQSKFEVEIENLRAQIKGSQNENFVRQQVEQKKLIEDNANLMREVKGLKTMLKEEEVKVTELYEDAQKVRDELMKELASFEKAKKKMSA